MLVHFVCMGLNYVNALARVMHCLGFPSIIWGCHQLFLVCHHIHV